MAHNIGANFLLEDILEKLNLLKKRPVSDVQGIIKKTFNMTRAEWQKIPNTIQETLRPVLFSLYKSVKQRLVVGEDPSQISFKFDLKHYKCFPHENGNLVSGIRINLKGREPDGFIKSGEELNDLCQDLSKDLLSIVEMDSGKPMVQRVIRTSEFFQGEYIDHLPDLLIEWNEQIMIGSKRLNNKSCLLKLTSEKIGLLEGEYNYCRTGDHRPHGLFIVTGPGIRSGSIGRTISIMDFASTFLHLFGLTNYDLDGKPISEIIDSYSPYT